MRDKTTIEVIGIGDELLRGSSPNTNAQYISQKLFQKSFFITRHSVISDEKTLLRQGLIDALNRSKLIIATGGLGPTNDDNTRDVAAELFYSDLSLDNTIAADLTKRFGKKYQAIQDQATVPTKAKILKNSVGTAPGLIFQNDQNTLILLPGVPQEMKPMFDKQVLPYITKHFPAPQKQHTKNIYIWNILEANANVYLQQFPKKHPNVSLGIYPHQGLLTVTLSATSKKALFDAVLDISSKFKKNIFESDTGKIEDVIHHLLIDNELTLSLAESCTGGAIASRITANSGSSQYFLGSIVSYSNQIKKQILKVPEQVLQEKGAVSEETVEAMVKGLLDVTSSDWGIAVSGIAGPSGGSKDKPVGTVKIAIANKKKFLKIYSKHFTGNREVIITRTVNFALGQLWKEITKKQH